MPYGSRIRADFGTETSIDLKIHQSGRDDVCVVYG